MASLGLNFDANTVDPNGDFPLIPPGKYAVQIIGSDMRPTKDGTGQYLFLEMEIVEGQEAGKKLFERLNLVNTNATAVRIAQQTLSQICHAVGVLQLADSEHLHARRMIADVRVEQGKNGYKDSNKVASYSAVGGAIPQAQAVTTKPATVVAGKPAGTNPPWRR